MSKVKRLLFILQEMIDEELESVCEMANIIPKVHKLGIDLKFHVEQPGKRLPPHFVNTKVFRGDFNSTDTKFTVSIPDLKVTRGKHDWLSSREYKKVMSFIKINTDHFIELFKDQGLSPDEIKWRSPK